MMIAAEGYAMVDELTADEIRSLLRLEPHATCGRAPSGRTSCPPTSKPAMSRNWRRNIHRLPLIFAPSRPRSARTEVRLRELAASPFFPLARPATHGSARAA